MRYHFLLFILLLSACVSQGYQPKIYNWDAYNEAMASEVLNSGDFNRYDAIRKFQEKLDSIPTHKIPPGALLHLAFLCEQEGLSDEAAAYLDREKTLFPESAHWINFILNRAKGNNKGTHK